MSCEAIVAAQQRLSVDDDDDDDDGDEIMVTPPNTYAGEDASSDIQDYSASTKFAYKVPASGELVECITESRNFAGEVLVYDENAKFIVLKDCANVSKPRVYIINLSHVIFIRKSETQPSGTRASFVPPNVPPDVVQRRLDAAKRRKEASWNALERSSASYDAFRTFFELEKLFGDIRWDGEKIIAFRCVAIRDPFDEHSVEALCEPANGGSEPTRWSADAVTRVKKILAKLNDAHRFADRRSSDVTAPEPSDSPSIGKGEDAPITKMGQPVD